MRRARRVRGDDTDCDDAEPLSHPGEDEVCDSLDNDCDGTVDEDDALDADTWYRDAAAADPSLQSVAPETYPVGIAQETVVVPLVPCPSSEALARSDVPEALRDAFADDPELAPLVTDPPPAVRVEVGE